MTKPSTFVLSREFAIPRDRMYAIWTSMETLGRAFGSDAPPDPRCVLDLRPGGSYHYVQVGPDGNEMWGFWEFTDITPGHRMQWLHGFADAHRERHCHPMAPAWPLILLSTVTFEDTDGEAKPTDQAATRVTITWEPYGSTASEDAAFEASHDGVRGGWTASFDHLARYVGSLAEASPGDQADPSPP
jgi:uncharacterized protein YndB with AHSA1/START domain